MRSVDMIAVLVLLLVPVAAQAAQEAASPPACRTAEINPVTGHTFLYRPAWGAR